MMNFGDVMHMFRSGTMEIGSFFCLLFLQFNLTAPYRFFESLLLHIIEP